MRERAATLEVLSLKPLGAGQVFVRALFLTVALAVAAIGAVSAQSPTAASTTQECHGVVGGSTSFVEQCGDRLVAWSLTLPFKREIQGDLHGRFFFNCAVEPMCEGEPMIIGRFVNWAEWQNSAKDEQAIFERANLLAYPIRQLPPMPPPACSLFDSPLAGMAGRAICFDESGVKGGINSSSVFLVVADDRVAVLLSFYLRDASANALRQKVVEFLPRFKIERATGDAALMKWFR